MNNPPIRPKNRFLIFGAPVIEDAEINEVVACMKSGWLGTGPKVAQFEEKFRQYKNSAHAVAVNSGTAALHLSIIAAGIKPGDEVITTALTFCATVNSIIHAGAKPVLVDVESQTSNLDPSQVEARITSKTKAILPVHFTGRPCNMDALLEIADRHRLKIIEDCAHAIETEYHGKKAGTMGDFGCLSFYVTKNVTSVEGGMVLSHNKEDAERVKIMALHGLTQDAWKRFKDEGYKHYQVVDCGFKYNMTDMQAAIGVHQLSRVEENWSRRQEIWNRYNDAFQNLPCLLPPDHEPGTRHAYHLYSPLLLLEKIGKSRDWALEAMTAENIGVGVHYLPVHLHPYYHRTFGWERGDFPNSEWIGERTLSLPLSPALSDADVEDVIKAFRKILTY